MKQVTVRTIHGVAQIVSSHSSLAPVEESKNVDQKRNG